MNEIERITYLREFLHKNNYKYYVENNPTLSDQLFDERMHELIDLEKRHPELYDGNSPTQRVGSDLNFDFIQVPHKIPMLSLANTYNREDVADFYKRIKNSLNGEEFEICCEQKFDGLSISLTYRDGALIQAITRGDGVVGDDVTHNVKTIKSIPLRLPKGIDFPQEFEMRGEVLMPWKSFNKLNKQREETGEQLFANPRNAASGTLKSKNSIVVAKRNLDAYLYYVLSNNLFSEKHFENLEIARSWGFQISKTMRLTHDLEGIYDYIDYWDEERKKLPVATDGIVLKVNSLKQQQILGYTAKGPRWAIAYKFKAERKITRLNEVTFQVGRTGAITPVANMDPIKLSGTVVRRASLHNEDIIRNLDLYIGDQVIVEKAGEIIPQIVGIDTKNRDEHHGEKVNFIKNCPICGTTLVKYEGESAYYCPNSNFCPPQIKGKIEHFVSRDAMNIDSMGPETIAMLYKKGLVKNISDLYNLRVVDISGGERTREKSARKLVRGIANSKNIPFERVVYALGIRFVGKVVAKLLAHHFKNIENLEKTTIDEIIGIEGVGNVIAESVINFFRNEKNEALLSRLKEEGLQMAIIEEQKVSNIFEGQNIVISGTFKHHSRAEYKHIIELYGGKNVTSISKNTSFILTGENMGPQKRKKAEDLNIEMRSEDDFLLYIK